MRRPASREEREIPEDDAGRSCLAGRQVAAARETAHKEKAELRRQQEIEPRAPPRRTDPRHHLLCARGGAPPTRAPAAACSTRAAGRGSIADRCVSTGIKNDIFC